MNIKRFGINCGSHSNNLQARSQDFRVGEGGEFIFITVVKMGHLSFGRPYVRQSILVQSCLPSSR